MAKQREIERVLGKYRERRLVESGGPLELHRAARERLFDAVEEKFGTDMSTVPTTDNAEEFAKTLAWQSGMNRWWHRMIPQIGMFGTCAAALVVIFLVVNRNGKEPKQQARSDAASPEIDRQKDFLSHSGESAEKRSADGEGANPGSAAQTIVAPPLDDTILADAGASEESRAPQPVRPAPAAEMIPPTAPAAAPVLKMSSTPSPPPMPRPTSVAAPSFSNPTVAPAKSASPASFVSSPSRNAAKKPMRPRPAPAPRLEAADMSAAADIAVEPAGRARKLGASQSKSIAVVLPPAAPASPVVSTPLPVGRTETTRPGASRPVIQIPPLPPPASLEVPAFEPVLPPPLPVLRSRVSSMPTPLPSVMKTPAATAARVPNPLLNVSPNPASSPARALNLSDLRQKFEQTGASGRYRRNFNSPPRQTPLKRFDLLVKGNTVTIRDSDGSIYNGAVSGGSAGSDGSFGFQVKGTHRATRQSVSFTGRYELSLPSAAAESSAFYNRGARADQSAATPRPNPDVANVIGQLVLAGKYQVEVSAAAKQ